MLSFLSLSRVIGGQRPRQNLQHLRLELTNHQGCICLLRRLTGKSQPPLTLLVPVGCAPRFVIHVVILKETCVFFSTHPPEAPWLPRPVVRSLFRPGSRVPRGSCTAGRPGGRGWAPKQTCVSARDVPNRTHVIQDCLSSRVGLPSEHGCGCDLGEDVPSGHHGGFRS